MSWNKNESSKSVKHLMSYAHAETEVMAFDSEFCFSNDTESETLPSL